MNNINEYLLEAGWTYDSGCTCDEEAKLVKICEEIKSLKDANNLDINMREKYALEIYNIISFSLTSVDSRADWISCSYHNSPRLKKLIRFLDEAQLCFYRKYYTGSLALLFITLEKYLRDLYGWIPGSPDPTFSNLKNSVHNLPNTLKADTVFKILDNVYSRYDSLNPSLFYFNRHGLLHGLNREEMYDEMNCARLFNLFNILCTAENVTRTAWGDNLELLNYRYDIYRKCSSDKLEGLLTRVDYT